MSFDGVNTAWTCRIYTYRKAKNGEAFSTVFALQLCLSYTHTHTHSPFRLRSTISNGFNLFKEGSGGTRESQLHPDTDATEGGKRSENRQYLTLHLPFCPPHSRPILHLLMSLPFLFVLFSVSADFPVYSLSLSSHAVCDPWPSSILYSLSPLSAAIALTYKGQGWERWTHG